jgi:hypothetical protein
MPEKSFAVAGTYHVCAAGEPGSQGAKSSEKQPSVIARAIAPENRDRVVRL